MVIDPSTLQSFKDSLTAANLYRPATETESASHGDTTLSRFLRARKGNVATAQKQFADTEAWRKEYDVDNLYRTFPEEEYYAAKRFYPRWTGRRDKEGYPVYVYHIASVGPLYDELHATPAPRRYQRIVALYESLLNLVLPICTHVNPSGASIPSCTTIIDCSSLSLGTVISLRSHLQESSRLATANYPETLHRIAVVNAPSFFPMIWNWIKGWFDEGTRNKIEILGKDKGKLKDIVHEEDLPKAYGGKLEWDFADDPSLDASIKAVMEVVPRGPAVFADGVVKSTKDL